MIKNLFKNVWKVVSTLILILSIAFLVMYFIGIKSFVVMSGSMEPTIHTGALVFVYTNYDYDKIKVDDIVTFKAVDNGTNDVQVVHRIVGSVKDGNGNDNYITQGDANDVNDGVTVTKSTFTGKELFSIPYIGYGIKYLSKAFTRNVLIIIIALIIFINVIFSVFDKKDKDEDCDDENDSDDDSTNNSEHKN